MELSEKDRNFSAADPLTNFEIQIYYQNEPKLKAVYSRNVLPNIVARSAPVAKDETYIINPDR